MTPGWYPDPDVIIRRLATHLLAPLPKNPVRGPKARMRPARLSLLVVALPVLGFRAGVARSQGTSIGEQTLSRMHSAYAGSWYHSLTFRQRTTITTPSGEQVEQWYESLAQLDGRTILRIDRGAPSEGNGILYTADSAWVIRKGSLAATRGEGNQFLPLIEGVYVQPVAQTAAELRREGFDLTKGYDRSWNGKPVTVVGAASESDSTSQQFWVDRERNLLVRMVIALSPTQTFDVRLEGYERAGKGWLATRVALMSNGMVVQREEYSDWRVDVPLSPALFDVKHWTSAPHWANGVGTR